MAASKKQMCRIFQAKQVYQLEASINEFFISNEGFYITQVINFQANEKFNLMVVYVLPDDFKIE